MYGTCGAMDSASDFESEGCRFESCQVRIFFCVCMRASLIFFVKIILYKIYIHHCLNIEIIIQVSFERSIWFKMNKLFLGSIKKFSKLVFALVALSLAYDYVIEKQSRSLDIKLSIESAKERVVYKFQNITVIQRPSEFDVVLIDDFKNLAETGEELELEQSHNTCPYKPPSLSRLDIFYIKAVFICLALFIEGPIDKIDTIEHSMEELETKFASLSPGGRWKPRECESRSRVAIIVPYRDRERHLRLFLNHMHPFLQRQQLDYGIYIIEEVTIDLI